MNLTVVSLILASAGLVLALLALSEALRKRPAPLLRSLNSRVLDLETSFDALENKFKKLNLRLNSAIYREKVLTSDEPDEPTNPNDQRKGESREDWEKRIRQRFLHSVR